MYHSITFTDIFEAEQPKNSWDDWHLIPVSRPLVNPPPKNVKKVDIPGLNGSLDFSDLLTGYATYQNRTGRWDFYVANDYWEWEIAYSTIMSYLHGKTMKCVLEDDPAYYYYGELAVDEWFSDKVNSKISISYDLYPYKKDLISSADEWLWDPFNFETGVIMDSANDIVISSSNRNIISDMTAESQVYRGVSFTVNLDGTITVNGESTSEFGSSITFCRDIDVSSIAGQRIKARIPAGNSGVKISTIFSTADERYISPAWYQLSSDDTIAWTTVPEEAIAMSGWIRVGERTNGEVVVYPYITLESEWEDEYIKGGGTYYVLTGSDEPVIPKFTLTGVSGSVTIEHVWLDDPKRTGKKTTHTVTSNGDYQFRDIRVRKGRNEFSFSGTGTVSIYYRGGSF